MVTSTQTSLFLPALLFLVVVTVLAIPSVTSVSVTVNPKTLSRSGNRIEIRWSGVPSPSPLDWLGIYNPPGSPDDEFIGYVFLNSSASWQSGSGLVELPLVNLRSPYHFRLFRWTEQEVDPKHRDHDNNPLPGVGHKLAVSDQEVRFASMNGPEQIHLSFANGEDEMRVMFVTGDGSQSFVRYGPEKGRLNELIGTLVRRYEVSHMCGWPANSTAAWRDPGFVHDALLSNLRKGTRYYYQVGSDSIGWSPIHSFVSRDHDSNETIAYLFGDMGTFAPYSTFRRTQKESLSTVSWILHDMASLGDKSFFISHIGDISYARGYSWLWDMFFNQIEPIAARVPYHVCMGNHEYDWPQQPWRPSWSHGVYGEDGGGECGVPYSLKFHMPGNSSILTGTDAPDTRNLYYSFDAGVVHFLYMSTETDFLPGSAQYAFIKQDLEGVDRKRTPFVVVQGHRPMYTSSNERGDAPLRERMLEHLEPLLLDNNVTLALWGHVHRFERFCALRNYSCVDNSSLSHSGRAPVHVVIGMAGHDWQPIWTPLPTHTDLPIFPQPAISMYRGGEFGYAKLVATREKLTLTYVGNHDGQVHDTLEIFSDVALVGGAFPDSLANPTTYDGNSVDAGNSSRSTIYSALPYVRYAGFIVLGVLAGYGLGFVVRPTWTPRWSLVKNEEI